MPLAHDKMYLSVCFLLLTVTNLACELRSTVVPVVPEPVLAVVEVYLSVHAETPPAGSGLSSQLVSLLHCRRHENFTVEQVRMLTITMWAGYRCGSRWRSPRSLLVGFPLTGFLLVRLLLKRGFTC